MKKQPSPDCLREPGQIVTENYLRNGTLRYHGVSGCIVGTNGSYFNNRPLYGEPVSGAVVLAGDRPFVRLIGKRHIYGAFGLALVRGVQGRWLHECSSVETTYRCGKMRWKISDPDFCGAELVLEALPLTGAGGMGIHFIARGFGDNARIVWMFGGVREDENPRWGFDPVMRGNPLVCKTGDPRKPELSQGFLPGWCQGNIVHASANRWQIAPRHAEAFLIEGEVDAGTVQVGNACPDQDPMSLANSHPDACPIATGTIAMQGDCQEIFWRFTMLDAPAELNRQSYRSPSESFKISEEFLDDTESLKTETPNQSLDAAVAAVCHAIQATAICAPPGFLHGAMAFSIPFLGWRVISGATVLGLHDRVARNASHYLGAQIREDALRTAANSDPRFLGCQEGADSRFYGVGSIKREHHMYDTQSQFFDQTIQDWRWTADPKLEELLRPALELHLQWCKECFDPDGDGLYESYINTLPSDCVWYNGGGSVEESAYAFTAHIAARDMARRAGDGEAVVRHEEQAGKIRSAVTSKLWLNDRGHFGLYIEQGGHRRLHADAWTLSQFLPIDARMTSTTQAWQALYYTEWALERLPLPFGGELCQLSNWVPSKWSVREIFGGDLFHLALAYFQSGQGDEGWNLLKGGMLETAFASAVPGGFSHIGAGTDFADNSHMFARTVAQGLFGYEPDYPCRLVRLRPTFPSDWQNAAIQTPDFSLDYRREENTERYQVELKTPSEIGLRLIVYARGVKSVILNGKECDWTTEPGYGGTWIKIQTPSLAKMTLHIELEERLAPVPAITVRGEAGEEFHTEFVHGRIVGLQDFHEILLDPVVQDALLTGRFATKSGHHLLLAEIDVGTVTQWQVLKCHISDSKAERDSLERKLGTAPEDADWLTIDMDSVHNADVRDIFQQEYISPRPGTCSVRLGSDGYSAWCFPHWGNKPPVIDLDNLEKLSIGNGLIRTPQNAYFAHAVGSKNISFASLWDNWPDIVDVPIGRSADAVWLLLCGTTFPMQTRIANATIHLDYADETKDALELVPPFNFWSLCAWGGTDYDYETDSFALPRTPPPMVQLGRNCRAMVLSLKLRPHTVLRNVRLEVLSQDVVIGLMGVSLMNPR